MADNAQSMMVPPARRAPANADTNRVPTIREVAEMISAATAQLESRLAAGSVGGEDDSSGSDFGNTGAVGGGGSPRESFSMSMHPFKVYWSYMANCWKMYLPDGSVTNDGESVSLSPPSIPTSGDCEINLVVNSLSDNFTARLVVGGGSGGAGAQVFPVASLKSVGSRNFVYAQYMTGPLRFYSDGVTHFNEKPGRIVLKGTKGEIKVSDPESKTVTEGSKTYTESTFTLSLDKDDDSDSSSTGGYDDHGCFALVWGTTETADESGNTTTTRQITGCTNKWIRAGSQLVCVDGDLTLGGDTYVNVTFSGGSVSASLSSSAASGSNTVSIKIYNITDDKRSYTDYRNAPVVVCYDPV